MKPDIEELRKKYIENPPEGMTSRDIRHMSEEELLDMDYFLNDDWSSRCARRSLRRPPVRTRNSWRNTSRT